MCATCWLTLSRIRICRDIFSRIDTFKGRAGTASIGEDSSQCSRRAGANCPPCSQGHVSGHYQCGVKMRLGLVITRQRIGYELPHLLWHSPASQVENVMKETLWPHSKCGRPAPGLIYASYTTAASTSVLDGLNPLFCYPVSFPHELSAGEAGSLLVCCCPALLLRYSGSAFTSGVGASEASCGPARGSQGGPRLSQLDRAHQNHGARQCTLSWGHACLSQPGHDYELQKSDRRSAACQTPHAGCEKRSPQSEVASRLRGQCSRDFAAAESCG
jgi:hypothetical protein